MDRPGKDKLMGYFPPGIKEAFLLQCRTVRRTMSAQIVWLIEEWLQEKEDHMAMPRASEEQKCITYIRRENERKYLKYVRQYIKKNHKGWFFFVVIPNWDASWEDLGKPQFLGFRMCKSRNHEANGVKNVYITEFELPKSFEIRRVITDELLAESAAYWGE